MFFGLRGAAGAEGETVAFGATVTSDWGAASWVGSGWIMWAAPMGTIVAGCPTPRFIGNCRVGAAAALWADSPNYRRFLIRQGELGSCDSWSDRAGWSPWPPWPCSPYPGGAVNELGQHRRAGRQAQKQRPVRLVSGPD